MTSPFDNAGGSLTWAAPPAQSRAFPTKQIDLPFRLKGARPQVPRPQNLQDALKNAVQRHTTHANYLGLDNAGVETLRSISSLVTQLERVGYVFWPDGDAIRFRGPEGQMDPACAEELRDRKSECLRFLERRAISSVMPAFRPATRPSELPLSLAQTFWHRRYLNDAIPVDNLQVDYRISGDLDEQRLSDALRRVVARHEVLRTRYCARASSVEQIIDPPPEVIVTTIDLTREQSDPLARHAQLLAAFRRRRFILEAEHPFCAVLVKLGQRDWSLVLYGNHIALDMISWGVIFSDMIWEYGGSKPTTRDSAAAVIQYADFALWEQEWIGGVRLEDNFNYWDDRLRGVDPSALLGHSRNAIQSRTETVYVDVSRGLQTKLRAFSRSRAITVPMIFTGVFASALAKWTRQTGIVFGMVNSGRVPGMFRAVGCYIKVIPCYVEVEALTPLNDILSAARYANVESSNLRRMARPEISERYGTMSININSMKHGVPLKEDEVLLLDPNDIDGPHIRPAPAETIRREHIAQDLSLNLVETPISIGAGLLYSTSVFDGLEVESFAADVRDLLTAVVSHPERSLSETFALDR